MSKPETGHFVGIHISADDSGDHVFLSAFESDGQTKSEETILRLKGTGFKSATKADSHASQYVVYAPISADAHDSLKALSGLLVELASKNALPIEYQSAHVSKNERQHDTSDVLHMNCYGLVIMGCLVSGIDLGKVFDMEDFDAEDHDTLNLKTVAYNYGPSEEANGYRVSYEECPADVATPRGFAIAQTRPGGPDAAFAAVSSTDVLKQLIADGRVAEAPKQALPSQILKAAAKTNTRIPGGL